MRGPRRAEFGSEPPRDLRRRLVVSPRDPDRGEVRNWTARQRRALRVRVGGHSERWSQGAVPRARGHAATADPRWRDCNEAG